MKKPSVPYALWDKSAAIQEAKRKEMLEKRKERKATHGNFSRNKGKRGEHEIARIMQAIIDKAFIDAHLLKTQQINPFRPKTEVVKEASFLLLAIKRRGDLRVGRNLQQAASGGYDIVGCNGFAPEVKYCEVVKLEAWSDQAVRQAPRGLIPLLWYRKNKIPWRLRIFVRDLGDPEQFTDLNYSRACMWLYNFYKTAFLADTWKLL